MAGRGRVTSLDIVRGLAALAVLVSHWDGWTSQGARADPADALVRGCEEVIAFFWHGGGIHPGVIAFIVLSGFCIHLPLARAPARSQAPGFWHEYARRRFWRIGPVYWVATLLGFGAVFLGLRASPPLPMELGGLSAFGMAASLLGITALLQPWQDRVLFHLGDEPLGTVTREILLYASYPWLVSLRRRAGAWAVLAVASAGYLLIAVLRARGVDPALLHGSYFEFLLYWVLGAAAAESLGALRASPARDAAIAALCWSAALAYSFLVSFKGAHVLRTLLFAIAVAALLRGLVDWEQRRRGPPGRLARWLAMTGERSYSLYAVHMPVMMALLFLQRVLGWRGDDVLVRWLSLGVVFACTELLFRCVERPAHQRARAGGEA